MVIEHFKTGRRPYRILFHPDGKSFFVTSWADGSLGHYQTDNGALLATVRVAPHPTDMVWRAGQGRSTPKAKCPWTARLFVAAANTNNVYALGVTDAGKQLRAVETINVAMTPRQPLGMTPSALGLSPDRQDASTSSARTPTPSRWSISRSARSHVHGFIPTGWYPTAARGLARWQARRR